MPPETLNLQNEIEQKRRDIALLLSSFQNKTDAVVLVGLEGNLVNPVYNEEKITGFEYLSPMKALIEAMNNQEVRVNYWSSLPYIKRERLYNLVHPGYSRNTGLIPAPRIGDNGVRNLSDLIDRVDGNIPPIVILDNERVGVRKDHFEEARFSLGLRIFPFSLADFSQREGQQLIPTTQDVPENIESLFLDHVKFGLGVRSSYLSGLVVVDS